MKGLMHGLSSLPLIHCTNGCSGLKFSLSRIFFYFDLIHSFATKPDIQKQNFKITCTYITACYQHSRRKTIQFGILLLFYYCGELRIEK